MSKSAAAIRAAAWVTVGVVAAGGVAAAATTSDGSTKTSGATVTAASTTSTPAAATPAKGSGKAKAAVLGKLKGRLLHGQFVVLGKGAKPTTLAEQRGTVDSVSSTAITLTSKDGFKQTYVVATTTKVRVDGTKSAIGDVKTGQAAVVVAGVDGGTQTARTIVERAAK